MTTGQAAERWRLQAPAGMTLAQAKAVFAEPPKPEVKPAAVEVAKPLMEQIILPSARDRWMTGLIGTYTPTMVENTIRGAMSGNLMSVWLMFDLMERTWPRLSKNLNELKRAVISLNWNVQPFALRGSKPTTEAQRRKRVIDQALFSMRPDVAADEGDFDDTLYNVMDAVGKGIALLEADYEPREINVSADPKTVQMQTLWVPRCTQWVHPRYYGYPPNTMKRDRLCLNAREIQQNNPDAVLEIVDGIWAEIPRDQFIVAICKQKSGHPLNGALLATLGYWWAASNFTWDWFINFAQIFGMPIRWATYAPNIPGKTINELLDMLRLMGNAGYAAFPEGTNMELKTGATDARNVPHKVLIDAADTICDILILGQTSSTQVAEGSGGLGSGHAAAIQGDVRTERIMSTAKLAAKVLNTQLLPAICRRNFGNDAECPVLVASDNKGRDTTATAERYKVILTTPGVTVSRAQYYEENALVMPEEGDDVLVAQAVGSAAAGELPAPGNDPAQAKAVRCGCAHRAQAKATPETEQLIDRTLAELTGVSPRWLGAVKPVFRELVAKAKDGTVTDADFMAALTKAQAELPEVFGQLDAGALEELMFNNASAAFINGAVAGALKRRKAVKP